MLLDSVVNIRLSRRSMVLSTRVRLVSRKDGKIIKMVLRALISVQRATIGFCIQHQ